MAKMGRKKTDGVLEGFSPASAPRIDWKPRKRSASARQLDDIMVGEKPDENPEKQVEVLTNEKLEDPMIEASMLTERRKALFEPLEPLMDINGRKPSAESLLPPPDFDSTIYPRGWLIGKKRKLVNVDVVESMRRIAIQEMNRKDREIDGLNEQLEEDAKCLEHLQLQVLQERSKRSDVERENAMLQDRITMLMNMMQENGEVEDDEP